MPTHYTDPDTDHISETAIFRGPRQEPAPSWMLIDIVVRIVAAISEVLPGDEDYDPLDMDSALDCFFFFTDDMRVTAFDNGRILVEHSADGPDDMNPMARFYLIDPLGEDEHDWIDCLHVAIHEDLVHEDVEELLSTEG